jgi:hypothetical protein
MLVASTTCSTDQIRLVVATLAKTSLLDLRRNESKVGVLCSF